MQHANRRDRPRDLVSFASSSTLALRDFRRSLILRNWSRLVLTSAQTSFQSRSLSAILTESIAPPTPRQPNAVPLDTAPALMNTEAPNPNTIDCRRHFDSVWSLSKQQQEDTLRAVVFQSHARAYRVQE